MTGARWLRVSKETSEKPQTAIVHIGISKRVAPLAVRRNRLKRLIREALRKKVRPEKGALYRIRIDRYPADLNYAQVERALVEAFK